MMPFQPDEKEAESPLITLPASVLLETISALEKIYAKQITMNNHAHGPWLRKRIEALRRYTEPNEGS